MKIAENSTRASYWVIKIKKPDISKLPKWVIPTLETLIFLTFIGIASNYIGM